MVALTIGMPTYNDFDGVYFTLQALRLYHDLADTELVVVDNYGCAHTKDFVENWVKGRYVLATEAVGTAAAKNRVFAEARGEAVLCCDSHVTFAPGAIARLKEYYREHPGTRDLLQGPLVYDDLQAISTHHNGRNGRYSHLRAFPFSPLPHNVEATLKQPAGDSTRVM